VPKQFSREGQADQMSSCLLYFFGTLLIVVLALFILWLNVRPA